MSLSVNINIRVLNSLKKPLKNTSPLTTDQENVSQKLENCDTFH
ncbi:hypothetical protein SAMN02745166_01095 [Prosthecobacter debontii]|uniref:Uncharacterized protein n=1 Tax=Prosthecobacter debontii TaxID=48467 RepID=A0A1T4X630_9BACT|nr:hypothetical protein SAMN02745166_01095 [Prosthecobacter debontii]